MDNYTSIDNYTCIANNLFLITTQARVCMFCFFRPRKIMPCSNKTIVTGEDPCLVDCISEKLFPQLSLEQSRGQGSSFTNSLHVITLREGDRAVNLPSLSAEQNYPQMLSELVAHI